MAKKARAKKPTIERAVESATDQQFAHLPTVAGLFQSLQRDRVGLERALATRGAPDEDADRILKALREIEESSVDYLTSRCERVNVYAWLREIKGVGPRLAGMLIGLIDIRRAEHVSSLWRYAGFGVVCKECRVPFVGDPHVCPQCGGTIGVSEQRRKGVKLSYNMKLKKTCFLLARSFLLFKTPVYFERYESAKAYYNANRADWPDGRRDLAARRIAIKLFLEHLWKKWREAENLSVGMPYAHAKLGHTDYIPPPEFPSR